MTMICRNMRAMTTDAGRGYDYDVCLSFAGEQRAYVEEVADALRQLRVKVFYDNFEQVDLWGKNLHDHFDWIYQQAAQFSVLFVSADYARKLWAQHERRSVQARAFRENIEYILPARFDDTEIPGLLPTVAYVDLRTKTPRELALLIAHKLAPTPGQPCRGWLESPSRGDTVGSYPEIRGRVIGFTAGFDLWIAHRRGNQGVFWPKDPMVSPDHNGKFLVSVSEGGPPGQVVISLLMVPKSRSQKFAAWLRRGHLLNHYPGLNPTNTDIELASVSVFHDPDF
jgi:hypothetical protein